MAGGPIGLWNNVNGAGHTHQVVDLAEVGERTNLGEGARVDCARIGWCDRAAVGVTRRAKFAIRRPWNRAAGHRMETGDPCPAHRVTHVDGHHLWGKLSTVDTDLHVVNGRSLGGCGG